MRRSSYLLLAACGLAAGCGAALEEDDGPTAVAGPSARRHSADLGTCYGSTQYYCDLNSPPPGTTTGCCFGSVSFCCPTGTSVCCPGADTTDNHCCNAAQTCQITGSVSGNFDAHCVAATCGGTSFNGLTQCCSPLSNQPVPKVPIARLGDCPNRVPLPGHVATSNGCGTKEHPLPHNFGPAEFTPACNDHDICYDTCPNPKSTCDQAFVKAMQTLCLQSFGKADPRLYMCIQAAAAIATLAINSSFGIDAYNTAQIAACQCCP